MFSKAQRHDVTVASKDGFMNMLGRIARKKIFNTFLVSVKPKTTDYLLDVGATTDFAVGSSNFLESNLENINITALGLNPLTEQWTQTYPQIPYIQGNALKLPFEDNSYDIVYSHAVIEHVGSFENQVRMIEEAVRVAKKTIWITTPNRWYPIELHTGLPFLHWLPKTIHRKILKKIGLTLFASEEKLNLLDHRDLKKIFKNINLNNKKIDINIYNQKFFGLRSNILVHIKIL